MRYFLLRSVVVVQTEAPFVKGFSKVRNCVSVWVHIGNTHCTIQERLDLCAISRVSYTLKSHRNCLICLKASWAYFMFKTMHIFGKEITFLKLQVNSALCRNKRTSSTWLKCSWMEMKRESRHSNTRGMISIWNQTRVDFMLVEKSLNNLWVQLAFLKSDKSPVWHVKAVYRDLPQPKVLPILEVHGYIYHILVLKVVKNVASPN